MKKTIIAILLNIIFGGVGYLYIKERKPLAIFLIAVTIYEFVRNMIILLSPGVAHINPFAIHALPMLSLLGSIPGALLLTIMGVDVYFLVKRQSTNIHRPATAMGA